MNLIYFGHQNMLCLKTKIPSIGSTGGVTGGKWFLHILVTKIFCVFIQIQSTGTTGECAGGKSFWNQFILKIQPSLDLNSSLLHVVYSTGEQSVDCDLHLPAVWTTSWQWPRFYGETI